MLSLLALLPTTSAFYVPGVRPLTFSEGDEVPLKVNSMTSIKTQLPKDYYRLPFCQPSGGPKMASENLGEFLTGNKIQSSPYTLNMLRDKYCQVLCQVIPDEKEAELLTYHINMGYHNNWIIDNLPSASLGLNDSGQKQKHYAGGFPIGFTDSSTEEAYVYNHANIVVDFHQYNPSQDGFRIVSFAVEPMSVEHRFLGGFVWDGQSPDGYTKSLDTCMDNFHMDRTQITANQVVKAGVPILYTYDVMWQESPVAWSSRWDVYLNEDHMVPAQVHWYSITNSILVVLFLSLLVVSILVRNLRKDIAGYNALVDLTDEEKEEEMAESGWKLVHADVFRPPTDHPMLYCVFVGTGVQLAMSTFICIAFSAVGFLSPARRGSLMTAILVFYVLCGILSGYVSSRLFKSFRGRKWQACTLLTATLFPGICFGIFLFFNIFLFFFHSSGSVPFLDVLIVMAMWCCVAVPIVFLGAYFGYKADSIEYPTVTSTIARAIPESSGILDPRVAMVFSGMVPFCAAYVELFFIMSSLWMDQFYYVFGFTFIVYLILVITCAEIAVLACYYQLCAENHRWWWFSFFCSGSTALYMFVYSVFWFKSLEASKLIMTYMLYFGYMFLISFAMFLVTGMIGTMSCLFFTRKIFGSIKID